MSDYLMLFGATLLLALGFVITKVYQKREGATLEAGLKMNVCVGLFTGIIFFFLNGMKIEITSFSIVYACLMAAFAVFYTIIGYEIIKDGQVALYTFFLMTGGMTVPYIFGAFFLGEEKSVIRTIGLIVIAVSVFITNASGGKKLGLKSAIMCGAIFVLNGFVSVVSKLHQINPDKAVSSEGFVLLTGVIKFLGCLVVLAVIKLIKKNKQNQKKNFMSTDSFGLLFISAIMSGVSYLLQLKGAINLPATVLYPIITGGSIIFTALAAWIVFKEKPDKKLTIGIIMCFIGTCMFL